MASWRQPQPATGTKATRQPGKVLQKPAETAAPKQPLMATADDIVTPPLSISKRKERSAQRLLAFQQKKRAAIFGVVCGPFSAMQCEKEFQRTGHHKLLARAKLRWLLWRAWAWYRPIYGGPVLGYTSLREQYVYKRAARLHYTPRHSGPIRARVAAHWPCGSAA